MAKELNLPGIDKRFHQPIVTAFKVLAVVEALTWVALLIAMGFKWIGGHEEAIAIPGMTHGIVFVVFVIVTLLTGLALKWSPKVLLLGLASSIPPLFTVWFEVWASRNGHLSVSPADEPGREPTGVAG